MTARSKSARAPNTRWWQTDLGATLLLALTVAAYWSVGQNEFVSYDDPDYVTHNPHVQAGLTREGIAWVFGNLHGERTYWHPVTWLSHMLDCQVFGLRPGPHHLMSLLFHTANVVLLFVVLRRMTGALWRSALVAALWSLHPLQVDSVAWVSERKNLLSTLFGLLTMLAYMRYAEKPGGARYLLVFLGLAMGLMCKPVLVTFPCVLLLLDFWPLRRVQPLRRAAEAREPNSETAPRREAVRPTFPPVSLRRAVLEKVPLLALAALSSVLTIAAHQQLRTAQDWQDLPLGLRLANAVVSYARYLKKVFWPDHLAVLYPHPGRWPDWVVLGSALLVGTVTALVVWRVRRAPHGFVGWFWFLGVLVPSIGLVQVGSQAMADRFAYQPLIGLLLGVVWGAAAWAAVSRLRQLVVRSIAVVTLIACLVVTSRQIAVWKNSITLYEHTLSVTGPSYVIEHNLAVALHDAGQLAKAKAHALDALAADPAPFATHLLLGSIFEDEQQTDEAMAHYDQALKFQPDAPLPIKGRCRLLFRQGRYEEAYTQLASLARATPEDSEWHVQLARVLARLRRYAEAIAHAHQALKLKPDWPEALNHFAWLLATVPQAELRGGPEAIRLAERACELTSRTNATFIGTLAAAYAETGRFDDAVKAATEAHDVARAGSQAEVANRILHQLELYQARKACREAGP
jgi:Flp pilus assembly protein TadD